MTSKRNNKTSKNVMPQDGNKVLWRTLFHPLKFTPTSKLTPHIMIGIGRAYYNWKNIL